MLVGSDEAEAGEVVAKQSLRAPVLLDADGSTKKALGVESAPTTVILDANGAIRQTMVGARGREAFEKACKGS